MEFPTSGLELPRSRAHYPAAVPSSPGPCARAAARSAAEEFREFPHSWVGGGRGGDEGWQPLPRPTCPVLPNLTQAHSAEALFMFLTTGPEARDRATLAPPATSADGPTAKTRLYAP